MIWITALDYNTMFCCDRHDDDIFDLDDFLPGTMYNGSSSILSTKRKNPPQNKYRPTKERSGLDNSLIKWLIQASEDDPLHGVQATYDILSDPNQSALVRTPFKQLQSPNDITKLFDEMEEWGNEWAALLFKEVQDYEKGLADIRVSDKQASQNVQI